MVGQVSIEFLGHLMQQGQASPWDGGKVVMLVVQTDIVREGVEGPVVAVGFRQRNRGVMRRLFAHGAVTGAGKNVVFSNEVGSARMQTSSQEGAHNKIDERIVRARELDEESIESELNGDIEDLYMGQWETVDKHGAKGVEEDLKSGKEGLAGNGVEKHGFKGGGKVSIEAVDAKGFMMCQVVGL